MSINNLGFVVSLSRITLIYSFIDKNILTQSLLALVARHLKGGYLFWRRGRDWLIPYVFWKRFVFERGLFLTRGQEHRYMAM